MPKIKSFGGYLVKKHWASKVVAPEYDTVPAEQRRIFADDNPQNFLNTMRLREDFNPASPPTHQQLLQFNRQNLKRLLQQQYFDSITKPAIFIYQLTRDSHSQIGIVCEIAADEYAEGRIRKHENTRRDREDLLADYQKAIGVTACPISLAYPQNDAIDAFIRANIKQAPALEFSTGDGVLQKVWCIDSIDQQRALSALFEKVENTYLTDGHHRAASGWRYAEMMRQTHGNNGDAPYNQLLVALFSDQELNLLPFHRCVRDLNHQSEQQVLAALNNVVSVTRAADQAHYQPTAHAEFGMYLGKIWYQLIIRPELVDYKDPVQSLDVSLLQQFILEPILGIKDFRSDPRLDYVTGIEGKLGLEKKCDQGWAVSLACFATSMSQLMDVADAGALMPPKSTYFDPKTRSGLFVRLK